MKADFDPQFDRRDFAAMVVLLLAIVAMFWRVLFTSQMFFYRDVFNYTYPHAKFIHDAVRHGYLPYWNPLLNYGEPVLADPNFLFFYPFTLLIILLPAAYAYCLHYVVHFAIAAIGAYCLARQWRQARLAALFAAAAFGLSGPLLSLGNFYNHAACAAWIPWALYFTDRALTRRALRPWILLTVCFSLQFLAGEMLTLLATFVLCFAYALWRAGDLLNARARWRIVAAFGCVGLLMIGLCAVQLLPASHLLAHSRRGIQGMPYRETTYWSFNPLKLIEFALPNFYGVPLEAPSIWDFVLNGRNDPYLPSIFIGFVTLFLALVGGVFGRDRRKRFAAVAAAALLLLSFGRYTPVFSLAYLLFPPLELVRFPVKLLVPFTLLIALLAGWGIDALRDPETPWAARRRTIIIPLACLLGAAAAVWALSFIIPGEIGGVGARILVFVNKMKLRSSSVPLMMAEVAGDGGMTVTLRALMVALITWIKVYLPGLAGFLLGAIIWFKMLEQKRPWARRVLPAVALLALCRLAIVNYSVNPTVPTAFYSYRPPVLDQVKASPAAWRFASVYRRRLLRAGQINPSAFLNFDSIPWVSRLPMLAQGDFHARLVLSRGTMLTGADVIVNNDVDLSFPSQLFHFWVFFATQMPDSSRADCLLGRTNVRYEIFDHPQTSAALRGVSSIFNGSPDPSRLYENLCATPRAYASLSAIYSASPLETLTLLSNPAFDVHQGVVLPSESRGSADFARRRGKSAASLRLLGEHFGTCHPESSEGPAFLQLKAGSSARQIQPGLRMTTPLGCDGEAALRDPAPGGAIKLLGYLPNAVTLSAQMKSPGYVVLLDRYSPSWHASVDGRPAALLRADLMFRAVKVGAGKHVVRFKYVQAGLAAGALISALALLLLIALYVRNPSLSLL